MAGCVGRSRTNSSGSISPPTTGGNCYRWLRKHYAKNCQLKKLPYETIPNCATRCALIRGALGDPWRACRTDTTPPPQHAQPVAHVRQRHGRRPQLTPRGCTHQEQLQGSSRRNLLPVERIHASLLMGHEHLASS